MPHRAKCGPLVALLERMRLCDPRQQPNRQGDDVFLAIGKGILWACQSAFEQTNIAKEVPFPGFLHLKPVFLDHRVDRQPARLIWQGRLAVWGILP